MGCTRLRLDFAVPYLSAIGVTLERLLVLAHSLAS